MFIVARLQEITLRELFKKVSLKPSKTFTHFAILLQNDWGHRFCPAFERSFTKDFSILSSVKIKKNTSCDVFQTDCLTTTIRSCNVHPIPSCLQKEL